MKRQRKVSVVLPVYNTERYLRQCLDSLRVQTFPDFEVICVDDGSTDNSKSIISEYAGKDFRFRLVEQENQGAGPARNLGLTYARGEYVLFLDSDDFFDSALIEKTYEKAVLSGADIVLFNGEIYDMQPGQYKKAPHLLDFRYLPKNKEVFSRDDIPDYIMNITSPAPWTKLYKKDFIEREKLQFQALPNANDVLFTRLSLCVADKITWLDECLVYYRVGREYSCTKSRSKNPLCGIWAYLKLYEELRERGVIGQVERSYVNAFIAFLQYNLTQTDDYDSMIAVYQQIFSEKVKATGVLGHTEDYYYNLNAYRQVRGAANALRWYRKTHGGEADAGVEVIRQGETKSPVVSVVIPVYNVEKYLAECLDSICGQTFENIEIICVNDGSTDNSLRILEEYADRDSRITVCSQKNQGPSAARNSGIKVSKGKYLYYMDSDDILELCALDELVERVREDNLEVLLFDGITFVDSGMKDSALASVFIDRYRRKNFYGGGFYEGSVLMERMMENGEYMVSPCLQFTERDFFIENALWFKPGILHEDNLYTFQSMLCAKRAGYLAHPLFRRRLREHSIMASKKTFANVYGFFVCALEMMAFLRRKEALYPNKCYEAVNNVLKSAKEDYGKLDETEKCGLSGLSPYQQGLFQVLVETDSQEIERCHEEIGHIQNSLSFRLGFALTYPLRKVRHYLKKLARKAR